MANKKSRGALSVIIILAVLLFVGGRWYIGQKNGLVALDEEVNSAWAQVENQLQRRSDLIPNFVATVKGYASHEEEVFTQIADARSKLAGSSSVSEAAESYGEMNSALSRLLVITESYPELQANENFIALQDELAGTENRIAVARKDYNDEVKVFNTKIRSFPASMFVGSMGFEKRDYFEISEASKENPVVSFD